MKVLHSIPGFGAKSGGTSTCTYELLASMRERLCDVDLLTLHPVSEDDALMGQGEAWIKALPNDSFGPLGYSQGIKRYLSRTDYDLYHTNGLWMYCNHETCRVARKKNKPYLITPHGMLYPDALRRSYWKKWPMLKLWFQNDIDRASCLHATCRQEMENIRLFGYRGPVAVVANPAVIPAFARELNGLRSSLKIGFLGRLHPIKKIENIFYGLALLGEHHQDFEVLIMGKGDDRYEEFLRREVDRLHLKRVAFCGFVNGWEKYERLASLSALFVPSDFENFGMIVPEALSVGTPVMASLGTPWEVLNTHRCGWWVDRSPENIAAVLEQLRVLPPSELKEMGERGRRLVAETYAAEKVAAQMEQLYRWLLGDAAKPEFVYG